MKNSFPRINRIILCLLLCISSSNSLYAQIEWENIGPGGGGWIECLAVDPRDENIVYSGSDVGGVYKSIDGGATWKISNDGLMNDFVRDIKIDPKNPDVIYLATPGGVHKSTNGGKNWIILRNGFPEISEGAFSAPVNTLAIDPVNTNIIYAGIGLRGLQGRGQIYKSTDAGSSWVLLNLKNQIHPQAVIYSICIHPANRSLLFIGTDYGIYVSKDAGRTWHESNEGLPNKNVRAITIGKAPQYILYLTVWTSSKKALVHNGGVYRSIDAGKTWQRVYKGLNHFMGVNPEPDNSITSSTTSNYYPIAADPKSSNVCYVADVSWVSGGLYKTIDSGFNWKRCTERMHFRDYGWITQWTTVVNSIAISDSNPNIIYIGTSGHIFKTEDAGNSWNQVYSNSSSKGLSSSRGLEPTCIYSTTIKPGEKDVLYVSYYDLGLLISEDGGINFKRVTNGMEYKDNTFVVVADPDKANILYAGTGEWSDNQGQLCKSQNAGTNWKVIGSSKNGLNEGRVRFIVVDPISPIESRTIYVGVDDKGVFKSSDSGRKWIPVNAGLPSKDMRALLMCPSNPGMLYCAIGERANEKGGLYKSIDAVAWQKVNQTIEFPDIQSIVIDRNNPEILYLAHREYYSSESGSYSEGGLFKSIDAGKNWERLLDERFVSAVAIDPNDSNVIYAGLSDHNYHDYSRGAGLLMSVDAGKSWTPVNNGMEGLRVSHLNISPNKPNNIYCATEGNGLFKGIRKTEEGLK